MNTNANTLAPIDTPATPATPESQAPRLYRQLAERFEPIMALAMHVRGTQGGRAMVWDDVATRMQALADAEAALPLPQDLAGEDMQACRVAAYTFVDEILLASPRENETESMGWYAHSLQLARLGSANGGELFYHEFSGLIARAADGNDPENASPAGSLAGSLASGLAALHPDGRQSRAQASALAAAAFFALCFLYGFRGRLYGQERAQAAKELGKAATALLGRMAKATPAREIQLEKPEIPDAPKSRSGFWHHPAIWFVVPVVLTGLWYLVCAEIVQNIAIP